MFESELFTNFQGFTPKFRKEFRDLSLSGIHSKNVLLFFHQINIQRQRNIFIHLNIQYNKLCIYIFVLLFFFVGFLSLLFSSFFLSLSLSRFFLSRFFFVLSRSALSLLLSFVLSNKDRERERERERRKKCSHNLSSSTNEAKDKLFNQPVGSKVKLGKEMRENTLLLSLSSHFSFSSLFSCFLFLSFLSLSITYYSCSSLFSCSLILIFFAESN